MIVGAFFFNVNADVSHVKAPLDVARIIGDKLIRETSFKYKLELRRSTPAFNDMHCIDFGRTFGINKPAVAYAYSILSVPNDMQQTFEIEHNDGCKIWVNGELVYEAKGDRKLGLVYEELSLRMGGSFIAPLKKGNNTILVKSETAGQEWLVYLQPPSLKGAVVAEGPIYPMFALDEFPFVGKSVTEVSNWIVIGPFENKEENGVRIGMEKSFVPESKIEIGKMYEGLDGKSITWTIPKVDVLGTMIDPEAWGTNYQWNYHNGGLAWVMQMLGEISGDKKYSEYGNKFCDFHIQGLPFVKYQVKDLNALYSANHRIAATPMLDYTLAPSLPFLYRLRKQRDFQLRDKYEEFVEQMCEYAKFGQIRLPGQQIYTRESPEKYTTWVDDMFMGIPFLIQAALLSDIEEEKYTYFNDAANQVLNFNTQVWDEEAKLYMHAKYLNRNIKLPHWSRANGWAAWAMSEVLMYLPKNHPKYKDILRHFRNFIDSLVRLQDDNGFWHNVLDRKDSPVEVSGTAIFTMAIARGVTHGWLSRKYSAVAEKGWNAIKKEIEPDGTTHKICAGTMCSADEQYYVNRTFYDNDTHGLFAVIAAAIEMHNMYRK